jgi:hypothetical protein
MLHSLFPQAHAGFSRCHCWGLSPMALTIVLPPMATPESRAKIRFACCRMWMPNFDAVKLRSLPTWPKRFSAVVGGLSARTAQTLNALLHVQDCTLGKDYERTTEDPESRLG